MALLLLPFGWPLLEGTGDFGAALTAADFDGDGIVDLAVGAPSEAEVHVFLGDGDGVAATASATFSGAAGSEHGAALAAADLDGDGLAELIVGAPGAG